MRFEVRDNWGVYTWFVNGHPISLHDYNTVVIGDREYRIRAAARLNEVYDHGHTYEVKTYDLETRVDVAGVPIWVSLYDNPSLRTKVRDIY